MKKIVFTLSMTLFATTLWAQESLTGYNFLRLPASAHAAALGGDNISIVEDDASLIFHNPALISSVTDRTVNLNYMTYMAGVQTGSASLVKAYKDRGSWGVMGSFMDYGKMKETTASGDITGDFSARDVMVGGSFAYLLNDRLAGGVTVKMAGEFIAGYSALAVGVDLGLNYYDEDRGLSLSAVARNLGGEVKAFNDDFNKMPLDVQLGGSKKLGNAPLRLSVTMTRLNDWSDSRLTDHLVFGVDALLSESIFLAAGFNPRRAREMKISDTENSSSHGAGLSFGGGLQLERFKLQVAYAKYHVSSSSLLVNVAYVL